MNCEYVIEFSALAANDLEEISDYISSTLYAEQAAKKLMRKILKQLRQLASMPEMCPLLDNSALEKKHYRKLVVDNYVVLYSVDHEKEKVNVIRMFYGARDYEKFL